MQSQGSQYLLLARISNNSPSQWTSNQNSEVPKIDDQVFSQAKGRHAKSSKIDKKLKMVELQLKKLKLDKDGNKDGGPVEESDGFVISDRNELMKKLLKKD